MKKCSLIPLFMTVATLTLLSVHSYEFPNGTGPQKYQALTGLTCNDFSPGGFGLTKLGYFGGILITECDQYKEYDDFCNKIKKDFMNLTLHKFACEFQTKV